MKKVIITTYIQKDSLKQLNALVKNYIFPNRSLLVNYCIELALPIIYKKNDELKKSIKEKNLPKIFNFLKSRGFIIKRGVQPTSRIPLGNIYFGSDNIKKY